MFGEPLTRLHYKAHYIFLPKSMVEDTQAQNFDHSSYLLSQLQE